MQQEQQGEIVEFKRRRPEDGELLPTMSLEVIYDYIRMLDGEGYPPAFIKLGNYKLNFSRASLKNGKIVADVEIMEDEEHE
jgi:methionyl-tRNA formyltransferase